uniref:Neurotransmitter-gated ion-channel ligand-binding domain-containing protein n=1 Tax=Meloidogyne incognita TaxID=6306 RepID=A0A914MAR0_MELIC
MIFAFVLLFLEKEECLEEIQKTQKNNSLDFEEENESFKKRLPIEEQQLFTGHRRLVEEILESYDPTVHPRRDFRESTRVNLSMSLYQILEVDERKQSIVVNVWMVQNWFDEFLDWDPNKFEMINKTIVPYQQIWVPDTKMDRRSTEALMNAIVETGYWRKDGKGAAVQLMFPAIYKLSCRMNVRFFPYDQQNCSFIISSWTHDSATINYHYERPTVNLLNFAQNDEWTVISFNFERIEQQFKCCKNPWTMLYAHLVYSFKLFELFFSLFLVIQRKPLYYIVNLVLPTSIITVVAVTGFFTPSSSSSERDEKLYLGINTLMTMMLMLLMV